ncbi:MAG: Uma2 family endonuclease [Ktedonobacteraceae bacterium]
MTTTSGNVPTVIPANWVPGPKQGHWTYNQYAALPDDGKRYEIVNGVLFMTPSPSGAHQDAVGRFYHYLFLRIETTGMGKVRIAPFDVQLSPDMVVQPDVMVILKQNLDKVASNRVLGAPDLVVEVASPGTATYDRHAKQVAYAHASVPEYWIADPTARTVEVFVLEGDAYNSAGIFEGNATLPSTIVPGLTTQVEQFFA